MTFNKENIKERIISSAVSAGVALAVLIPGSALLNGSSAVATAAPAAPAANVCKDTSNTSGSVLGASVTTDNLNGRTGSVLGASLTTGQAGSPSSSTGSSTNNSSTGGTTSAENNTANDDVVGSNSKTTISALNGNNANGNTVNVLNNPSTVVDTSALASILGV